jgi:DNA-binding response OmpR family regulator
MMSDKRRKEIAESLRRLAANYTAAMAEFDYTLAVLCRKLEIEELMVVAPGSRFLLDAAHRQPQSVELVIDRASFTCRWHGRTCFLGNSLPFRLLERLSRRPNHYVSCTQLLDEVWGGVRSRAAIRSVVKVLRQKLSRAGMRDLARALDGRTAGHYVLQL